MGLGKRRFPKKIRKLRISTGPTQETRSVRRLKKAEENVGSGNRRSMVTSSVLDTKGFWGVKGPPRDPGQVSRGGEVWGDN